MIFINSNGKTTIYYKENNTIKTVLILGNNLTKTLGDLWIDDVCSTININKESNGMPTYTNGQKPLKLIERILRVANVQDDDIVMDFFSGSSTTAHAVYNYQINNNLSGVHYIMVQLVENLDSTLEKCSTSEEKKKIQVLIDYLEKVKLKHYITEFGKQRIRLAIDDISNKLQNASLDLGFRVLKLSDSNMKDVYYNPDDYSQDLISQLTSNIKDDRNEDDLLFASLLDRGIDISKSYRKVDIDGKKVIIYNEEGDVPEFIACFDNNITEKCVTEIAKMKPLKATFRDSSFGSSSDRINVEEIFKLYSKDTRVSVM